MRSVCELCQLYSPSGCAKLSNEPCLKEAVQLLKDSVTNGEMIKAITGEDFSRGTSIYNHDLMICEGEYYLAFNVDWWNAPYRGEEE